MKCDGKKIIRLNDEIEQKVSSKYIFLQSTKYLKVYTFIITLIVASYWAS